MNIEQGALNQYGYPLNRRHLVETTITSGFEITAFNPYAGFETARAGRGQRAICIDENTISALEKFTAVHREHSRPP